jgi:hypothetical protein
LKNKEGEKYYAWIKLDFLEKEASGNFKTKQYHEGYKYDLVETLQKYHIRELGDTEQKERLIQSLQRGNTQLVTFEKNRSSEKLWIEASPQFKSINVLDDQNRKVYIQLVAEKYGRSDIRLQPAIQTASPEPGQIQAPLDQKPEVKTEVVDMPKVKESKRAKHSHKL